MAITQGTWEVWQSPSGKWAVKAVYEDDQGNRHTTWPAVCNATGEDNEANARLIAAAPKLQEENARLKALLAEALKALEPFAMVAKHDISEDETDNDAFRPMPKTFCHAPQITVGHIRAARRVREGGRVDD